MGDDHVYLGLASFQRMLKCSGIDVMLRFWHVIVISSFVFLLLATAHAHVVG